MVGCGIKSVGAVVCVHGTGESTDTPEPTDLALTRARKPGSSRPLKNLQSTVPALPLPLPPPPPRPALGPPSAVGRGAKASAAKSNTYVSVA